MLLTVCIACNTTEVKDPVEYTGPEREIENIELFYSEQDQVKVKMVAPMLYEFKNGDREFPEGVNMEFYDLNGNLESTLKANHAYYFKEQDQWRGRGKVEVRNVIKQEQLNTEELFWKPVDGTIFTDKFVTIKQEGDIIYGEGLQAKEDLSDYTITEISGIFTVRE